MTSGIGEVSSTTRAARVVLGGEVTGIPPPPVLVMCRSMEKAPR